MSKPDINAIDENGKTKLMSSCSSGDFENCKSLLKNDADVNLRDNRQLTALMYAFDDVVERNIENDVKIIHLLLDNGADVNALNADNETIFDQVLDWSNDNILSQRINALTSAAAAAQTNGGNDWPIFSSNLRSSPEMSAAVLKILDKPNKILLATILPNGDFKNNLITTFSADAESLSKIQELQNLKKYLATQNLTEAQQNSALAGKLGLLNNLKNTATYLAVILPDEILREEIIENFNNQNPDAPLEMAKIKVLRTFFAAQTSNAASELINYIEVGKSIFQAICKSDVAELLLLNSAESAPVVVQKKRTGGIACQEDSFDDLVYSPSPQIINSGLSSPNAKSLQRASENGIEF